MKNNILSNEVFFDNVIEMLSEGKTVTVKLSGYSMTPTFLNKRDELTIKKIDSRLLKPLDVALFHRADGVFCLHRIIKREGDLLSIRGDGNYGPFEKANVDDVIGVVISGTMKGGTPFNVVDIKWQKYSRRYVKLYPIRLIIHPFVSITRKIRFELFGNNSENH